MTATYRLQLPLLIITYVIFSSQAKLVNTIEYTSSSKINQKILIGPTDINARPDETIQFPCIVSKQSDAIVTWCWNDFCTLGKTQLLRHETAADGLISIYQYTAYPRFQLYINERLNHYNLSIVHVSNKDEGIFQCQVQRTMNAHEARSERVHLTLIAAPNGQPTLLIPNMPLKQGQPANITCLSSPSKPASKLVLYKNDQIIDNHQSSLTLSHELDVKTKKNLTKLVYTIDDPDSTWDNARVRCEQTYKYADNYRKEVFTRFQVFYKPKARIESQNRHPLTVNATAAFRCIVHGNPEPQFRWFANSMDLTSLKSSVINIPLSRHVHNHSIGCTASNIIGTTNTSIRLLIRFPPVFIIRPPKFVVLDLDKISPSNPVIIRCIVDSYPRSRITWHRYGQELVEGPLFNLSNVTTREQQGVYSYRIDTEGFESITETFVVYIKGKPLIYIEESDQSKLTFNREFECQVYSSSSILKINWKLNDQSIESSDETSISTICDDFSCLSKLITTDRKIFSSTTNLNRLSCLAENEYGIEQSRLYQINVYEDPSSFLIPIVLGIFLLIIILSIVAIICGCRAKQRRKRSMKKLPVVYDAHYSINELIKDVGCLRTNDLRSCQTTFHDNDQLSLKIDQTRLEPTDHLLTTLFNNNTKRLLDNLSNESSTNSSGFHSKSTTTTFNAEYSPRFTEINDYNFPGISPLYTSQYQINV